MVFDETALIRFKLFNDSFETSNYPTEQAQDFVHQAQIDNFPPFDRLHFGYRLNITGLSMQDAFITLPTGVKGAFNAWMWQVLGDPVTESSAYGIQLPMVMPGEKELLTYAYDDYSQYLAS